ncbi:MAG: DUF4249 family protein [Marinifilaceae bacterium]
MRRIYIIFLLSVSLYSCVEDYDLKLKDYTAKHTIDATISTDVDYNFVRISKIKGGLVSGESLMLVSGEGRLPKDIGVENAIVKIQDSKGNTYEFLKILNTDPKGVDDVYYEKYVHFKCGYGYYKAPAGFKAIVGETYTLDVKVDNMHYTAISRVLKTPQITKIEVRKQQLEIQKEESMVPFISFTDVDVKNTNYYISQLYSFDINSLEGRLNSSSRLWGYSIFDDALLKPKVKDFKIGFGTSSNHLIWYPDHANKLKVKLMSINKEAYEYYKILVSQIKNDGGMYSPSPASPVTNIKGGALGYFMTLDVSTITSNKF